MKSTVDREVHSIEGLFTCKKWDHTRHFIWCGGPADREAVTKSDHYGFTFLKIECGVGRGGTRYHGAPDRGRTAGSQR